MSKNFAFRRNRRFQRPRPLWRKIADYAFAVFILAGLILVVAQLDERRAITQTGTPVVNDGDSLTIDGKRIRLWGIDAPELHQNCTADGKTYPCGRKARDALRALIGGAKVDCRSSDQDQYGRLLAICSVGSVELNRTMVEAGWALAYGGYDTAQTNARSARKGIWAGEFERPRDWRQNAGHTAKPTDDFLARLGDRIRKMFSRLFYGA